MELVWHISTADIDRVRDFLSAAAKDPLVEARVATNLATRKEKLSKAGFWHALVGCLLTTQQKSGPNSAVARFMRARPFPISYNLCRSESATHSFVTAVLSDFGGIRRSTRIGKELAANLTTLQGGRWDEVLERVNSLLPAATREKELEVAEYLDELLIGLGPKQSRNLLQGVGFTKYEIPIDSRITKWLNRFGFPIHLSAAALADRHYYNFVSTGVQQLCAAAGAFPCIFDAAIFASFDAHQWTKENTEAWGYDDA